MLVYSKDVCKKMMMICMFLYVRDGVHVYFIYVCKGVVGLVCMYIRYMICKGMVCM